ncbi:NADH-quinone oxidoreductase subunit H [Rhodopila sp.]|uniref:NADH-quinone oxidoreductase subunit H n=1 Tax=Rhodopila sp. TaxID=2480087 RepID=UPI002B52B958|nr:NADH-quinone oxidoreductase subunit H [Rhodopila sp.]HVZ07355.1 NADH-quinone oxidoreductase subunit H [Rhodopila sp.]
MNAVIALMAQLVHLALVAVAAPAVASGLVWLDARLAGRTGPPLMQPVRELIRLSRKIPAVPENTSPVFVLGPSVGLAAIIAAAALVPSFSLGMALSPLADGLVVVSLLTIARIAACLTALDIGTAASGRAAEARTALAILAEPGLLLVVFALALMGGGFNLDQIIGQQRDGLLLPASASAVALACLLTLAFVDASAALPDLAAECSGIDLALSRAAGWLRTVVWINLLGALFLPIGMAGPFAGPLGWLLAILAWALKLAAATLGLALARTFLGRPGRQGLSNLLGITALIALLATLIALSGVGSA